MAGPNRDHKDRGDGVCVTCYEEMPCAVLTGEARRPRIHEDELEELLEQSRIEGEARERIWDLIAERLDQLGIEDDGKPVRISGWSKSITLKQETLAQIVALIPSDCEGVGRGPEEEVPPPECDEDDELLP